jgi:hypothetical protein
MDFLDSYSYGYDQVNVNPVRYVNYDDSEFTLARNNLRDPTTKKLHEKVRIQSDYDEYQKNTPFYSSAGMQKRYEKRQIKENIEDILRPYSRSMARPAQVKDRIMVEGNDIRQLKEELSSKSACKNCRIRKKCKTCSEPKSAWIEADSETNLLLLVLVVILTAFCVVQYVNTQTINATLMGMINEQQNPAPWLSNKKRILTRQNNSRNLLEGTEVSPGHLTRQNNSRNLLEGTEVSPYVNQVSTDDSGY